MELYDLVELINDKPKYNKADVFKGTFGAVMSERTESGERQVVFSEFHTGKDIADILVEEEDLKVYSSMPPERIPEN
jgi:hypothetical protein